ncbi:MAG: acetyl-CoA carboxylase biotin carboxyl carrier protein [Planctomycetaceae bacterium]|jgi:acetyl-CoA carboxylase biotin carboxyl carrier protein|nr:acetyl-CoA carboxylase biotin carboxyl carrier protein [Planctomycetaceae bacterium]
MVNSSNSGNDVFDIRRIKRLVELMQENGLTELDIQQSDMRIQLKRNVPVITVPAVTVPSMTVPTAQATAVSATSTTASPNSVSDSQDEKNVQIIKSPMVGTFYVSPKPDAPAFVKIGDSVNADTTVCLIEAMKVYNEIQAECSGKVVAVLAQNGETVEFGKPLFRVTKEE